MRPCLSQELSASLKTKPFAGRKRFNSMRRWIVLILPLLMFSVAWAEETVKVEEVVVTASRLEEPLAETTSDVIVIKKEDIEKTSAEFVMDTLRRVPDLNITQNGGKGKTASLLLRGASSNQTLVMIDGVKVKSTTTGDFDLAGLLVDDIERIEIVKGPQSTMYGSEAMAGVINIITKKGSGEPKAAASLEVGAYSTYKPAITVSGAHGDFDYRMTASYYKTEGISSARLDPEKDSYRNFSVSGKFGFKLGEIADVELNAKHYYDRNELDAFDMALNRVADDLNYVQRTHHTLYSAKGKLYLLDVWEQALTLSSVRDLLIGRDPDTAWNNFDIDTSMKTADWQHNLYLHDQYTLTLGFERRKEEGNNVGVFNNSIENKALYLNNKLKFFEDALVLNAGLRHDNHETAGSETTYRLGALYNFKSAGLKLRAGYATGFRAPTLNELFFQDPWGSSGNLDLKPEKSKSWEVGIEKDLIDGRVSVSTTYFRQDYEDLIQWVMSPLWTWSPENVADSEIKGLETSVTVRPTDTITIMAGHTYLDTEDETTGKRLTLRPYNKANLSAEYSGREFSVVADFLYVGDRYAQSADIDLGSYGVVNLSGRYSLSENLTLHARVENLLDKDYEEAAGYGTPGISVYSGVKAVF
jgi:vitamin B12 transporter